ncbi:adenylyl-sulfate kinase [Candidatus Pelagibacter sp.]|nr:adenylyl-sulfate kinase [Candidatus Pelagibacter sp.]
MKLNNKKGILFWVTGLSGAGKTSISNKIYKSIRDSYGKTFYINGDEMRKILDLKSYNNLDRKKGGIKYSKLFKKITDQNINVLFAGMALFNDVRSWNRKNVKNYLEIYIKTDLKNIIKKKYTKIYRKKSNLVGVDIKPEFPKNPDIIIYNNFSKSIEKLSEELILKIKKKINK